jgi:hypothetical protein
LVCVVNHSTAVTDSQVAGAVRALQRQVTYHFEPHWNAGCTILVVKDTPAGDVRPSGVGQDASKTAALEVQASIPQGAWLLVIADDSDQAGALGYHDVDAKTTPIGFVFAKTDIVNDLSWTVTASHELLEMLGDPLANQAVQVGKSTFLAYEAADAVEADEDGYEITLEDGEPIFVSDFVFPNWFVPDSPGPWDYRGLLTSALELRPGGYIGVWTAAKGWGQAVAKGGARHDAGPRFAARRTRRALGDKVALHGVERSHLGEVLE